jgi:hypothetical protein
MTFASARPPHPAPGVGGGAAFLAALEPRQHSGSPPGTDGPALRQPPAWTRKLRTPAIVPKPNAAGRGNASLLWVRERHPEIQREDCRDAEKNREGRTERTPRQTDSCRDHSERHGFKERRTDGTADRDLAATGGGAPRTHTRARTPTHSRYTHSHTLRRFPPTKPSYNLPGGGKSASAPLPIPCVCVCGGAP